MEMSMGTNGVAVRGRQSGRASDFEVTAVCQYDSGTATVRIDCRIDGDFWCEVELSPELIRALATKCPDQSGLLDVRE